MLEHVLISDFSSCIDAVMKHYQFELNQVAFSLEEQAYSAKWLNIHNTEHAGKSTLSSIR
jgi:hypothetical protein